MKKRFSIEYNEGKAYIVDWHFEYGNKIIPDETSMKFAQELIPILNDLNERLELEREMGKTNRYIANSIFESMGKISEEKKKGNIIFNEKGTFIKKEANL